MKEELPPLFWYARNITVERGRGLVYAEHPTELGPDNRKAPVLVLGYAGMGRSLFSAVDDTWRWRFYTAGQVFNNYWVQQLRWLSRSKKLGQRTATLTTDRPQYDVARDNLVKITLRILDLEKLQQLADQVSVEIEDETGAVVRREKLIRVEASPEEYTGSFQADKIGSFRARVAPLTPGMKELTRPFEIAAPQLELNEPALDRVKLTQLAANAEAPGAVVEYAEARQKLPAMITSLARNVDVVNPRPVWDAPLALVVFVLLITLEWVLRKVFGML